MLMPRDSEGSLPSSPILNWTYLGLVDPTWLTQAHDEHLKILWTSSKLTQNFTQSIPFKFLT